MSWRGKYIGWYRVARTVLGKLVPELTDNEVMENVSIEDEFIAPTGQEDLPRNKVRPIPRLSIKLSDAGIELGIVYTEPAQIDLLKNIFKESHTSDMARLMEELGTLAPRYETVLYSREREKKPMLIRKYVSARVDAQLLEHIIEESENLRKGGRRIMNNESVYIQPKTPLLYLTRVSIGLDEFAFRDALEDIKPLYKVVTGIKTQREIISSRLSGPVKRRNNYREFIELLNAVRGSDLISAQRRREINKMWRDREDEREELMDYLRGLLDEGKGPQNVS